MHVRYERSDADDQGHTAGVHHTGRAHGDNSQRCTDDGTTID
jgi:hypothetical protein